MKKMTFTSILIMLLAASCNPKPANTNLISAKKEEQQNISLKNLKGEPIILRNYEGKKIILNFWATWCKPCIAEMPSLERVQAILEKENYIMLLASDESIGEIKEFKNTYGFNLNFIQLKSSHTLLNINALPTTFVYNIKGQKVDEILGAVEWDSPQIINRLKNIQ